ncbi:MAG: hypothetical protein Kow0037_06810 [Calditrichia bacterium]
MRTPWGKILPIEIFHTLIIGSLLLFITCGKNTHPPVNREAPLKLFQRGVAALEAGRPEEAKFWVNKAIQQRPQLAMFHYVLGQIYLSESKKDSAISAFETALNFKSHYPEVWVALAPLYVEKEQYEAAIPILNSLVERFPDSTGYRLTLAEMYIQIGKAALGLDELKILHQNGSKTPEIFLLRGMAYLALENYEKAIAELEEYLRIRPESLRALKMLGVAYLKNGDPEKGMSLLNRALQIQPNDGEVFLYRAEYFWKNGKMEAAEAQLNRGLKLDSLLAEGYSLKAKIALARKDTTEAVTLLEKALRIKRQCYSCMRQLAFILFNQKNLEEARYWLERYMQTSPVYDAQADSLLRKLPNTY